MRNPQTKETGNVFYKNRIDTLTDGVFAIAMTLLVTGLNIPTLNGIITTGTVDSLLLSLFPDFIHYFIAFGLLAGFWWSSHLRSHYIRSIDSRMGFLTITSLFFVGLIPFSTNLAGDFPLNTHAVVIFELNLLAIGMLSLLQWNHILKSAGCRDPDIDMRKIVLNRDEACIFPVLSCLAILLAIMSVPWGIFVYVFAPLYIILVWLKETRSSDIKNKSVQKTG